MENNKVEFQITGKMALFTDPATKTGGEKLSYPIPTYQALKGIVENIYWKPTIYWVVDAVRIMNAINMQPRGMKPLKQSGGNALSIYTYLIDVKYQVRAHFEFNMFREDLRIDRSVQKHISIARRMIEFGGRRDIFLGTRECQAYVEPCAFGEGKSRFDETGTIPFGIMYHGISYPNEIGDKTLYVRLWDAKMQNGVVKFPTPKECNIVQPIRNVTSKCFTKSNIRLVSDEFIELQRGRL